MMTLQTDIRSLIPQRPPFVMVDHLLVCDNTGTRTTLQVKEDNVLVYNGELSEAGLVENIAQTAAAGAGYSARQANKPISDGYIASVKNLEIFALPKTGDTIETYVTILDEIFDVTIIAGTVTCNGELMAKCEMKIFIKN